MEVLTFLLAPGSFGRVRVKCSWYALTYVDVDGMSEGTRDQLYLALRLAALDLHLDHAHALPFIADDLFINYDDARSKAGLEALGELSRKTQVIFLTHHDHLLPAVHDVFGERVNVVTL
jgi:uncharacterized protein YhaN